jgi:predicted amidophosphoribosyltransferase
MSFTTGVFFENEIAEPCLVCLRPTRWNEGVCSNCTSKLQELGLVTCPPDHIPPNQHRKYMTYIVKEYEGKITRKEY